jgi:putative membrane protein
MMPAPDADRSVFTHDALRGVRRPVPALMAYYVLLSIAAGPGVIIALLLRIFRFRTLQYEFDEQGVTMRWGILFRREISLTYARIQDIHLVSNLVERWLGLGRVQLQTASAQAAAEMTIEGLSDFERLRDELYQRMRGARLPGRSAEPAVPAAGAPEPDALGEVAAALRDAVDELRAIRALLSRRAG